MTAITIRERCNGVDVGRLNEIIDAVTGKPILAQFTYVAQNEWVEGAHNRSRIRDYIAGGEGNTSRAQSFVIPNDVARPMLGTDIGANPLEYVLSALVGCLTTTLVYHAALQGVRIDEIKSTVEGDQDVRGYLGVSNKARNGFDTVRIRFQIKGDASEARLQELVELAQRRSPVFDVVSNPVKVRIDAEVKPKKDAA